jgi:hypothetical protein
MSKPVLLTRDQFREKVFARDRHKCVFCDLPAQDAHHILERRLWLDGGYYLVNGASVCGEHHLACERTDISVEEVRQACKITDPLLPPDFEPGRYDKWGNPVLPNGQRLKGKLFNEESVQKILGDHVMKFTDYVKYSRTPHLPWSPGGTDDDKVLPNVDHFIGKQVVVTEKLDGENSTLYHDYMHARSLDSKHHPSRDWLKQFHASIRHDIPKGMRICGENLYAVHSIRYERLPSYFIGFSMWNEKNVCLSWVDTLEWFELLGITAPPMIYTGLFNEALIRGFCSPDEALSSPYALGAEGYVVRLADEFPYDLFGQSIAKFVRKGHVQTSDHWSHLAVIPNGLLRK